MSDAPSSVPEIDPELRRAFWIIVGLLNAALFGISLGLFMIVFDEQSPLGVGVFMLGIIALGLAVARYRRVRKS